MTKEEIIEGNKLIAEFDSYPVSDCNYHASYDMLMPVWVKFRDLKLDGVVDNRTHHLHCEIISISIYNSPIQEAFEKLVEGIKWYKQKEEANGR